MLLPWISVTRACFEYDIKRDILRDLVVHEKVDSMVVDNEDKSYILISRQSLENLGFQQIHTNQKEEVKENSWVKHFNKVEQLAVGAISGTIAGVSTALILKAFEQDARDIRDVYDSLLEVGELLKKSNFLEYLKNERLNEEYKVRGIEIASKFSLVFKDLLGEKFEGELEEITTALVQKSQTSGASYSIDIPITSSNLNHISDQSNGDPDRMNDCAITYLFLGSVFVSKFGTYPLWLEIEDLPSFFSRRIVTIKAPNEYKEIYRNIAKVAQKELGSSLSESEFFGCLVGGGIRAERFALYLIENEGSTSWL